MITPLEAGALSLVGVVLGGFIGGRIGERLSTLRLPERRVVNEQPPLSSTFDSCPFGQIELDADVLAAIGGTGLTAVQAAEMCRRYGQANGVSWYDLTGDTPSTSHTE